MGTKPKTDAGSDAKRSKPKTDAGSEAKRGKPKTDARAGAFDVLTRIENGAYANLALDTFLEGPGHDLPKADRGLLTELVNGVVKHRLTLDWIIDQRVTKTDKLEIGPRILLRLGLYQLGWLDRIPARAATYETVELARRRYHSGVASLVNGTLRGWLRDRDTLLWPDRDRDPAAFLSVRYSHPLWIIERWLERYGMANTETFCQYNNMPPPLQIRTNTLRITRDGLAARLANASCRTEPGCFAPEALTLLQGPAIRDLKAYHEGLFTVQDESSMLVAHALDPLPGQTVLDACAAPGGKTTHLAQLMDDQGAVVAWDIHPHRVRLIQETQQRLGIRCIHAVVRDASGPERESGANAMSKTGNGPNNESGSAIEHGGAIVLDGDTGMKTGIHGGGTLPSRGFDRILVDAPCSGLGVLRRRADARWNRKPEDITNLAALQEKILRNALSLLAPGGKLLYSTCTTEPEENRLVVERALAAYPLCRRSNLDPAMFPDAGWDMQLLPFADGMEGFYMALIEKAK